MKMRYVSVMVPDQTNSSRLQNIKIPAMLHRLIINLYKLFLKTSWLLYEKLNIRVRGIGVASDLIKFEFSFLFKGCEFRFVPIAGRSYGMLPAGLPNEPETHIFLNSILNISTKPVIFVDIGASIGEFVITMANDKRVAKVYAFEPHPKTFMALSASASGLKGKIELFEAAVGEKKGELLFSASDKSPTGAGFGSVQEESAISVAVCRIDETLDAIEDFPAIVLIDIEGGELSAIRGGLSFIGSRQPLIIFEYNMVSRNFFTLEQMQECLTNYNFYRLQSHTGKLDLNLEGTWNVVAIPGHGFWSNLRENKELFDVSCQMPSKAIY
jgi:FkbM family methyltransferase